MDRIIDRDPLLRMLGQHAAYFYLMNKAEERIIRLKKAFFEWTLMGFITGVILTSFLF